MATATATELVNLVAVNQFFGAGRQKFTALQDIHLAIREGDFVALVGPSGCGKSTLLRIITGLQQSSEGCVFYHGEVLRGVNPKATIVFQSFALFPWLTALENVEVALKAKGMGRAERLRQGEKLLDDVGLDGFEDAYPREMSGGMRQKVGIARAMAVAPELLCLDEPFSALDVLSADALRGELLELWTGGKLPTKAILLVTHNIEEAVFMADRILVMEKQPGRITKEIRIPLPHPRRRRTPEFLRLVDEVYTTLAGKTQPAHIEAGTAPGEMGLTRLLPRVSINEVAGLLEHLEEREQHMEDIYALAADLKAESDRVLRIMEAAELLGFATVDKGDAKLTLLGKAFVHASILGRKEILASRVQRLPIFKWLLTMLGQAKDQALERGVILTSLGLEFPPEECRHQLHILINWGRHAEVLGYNGKLKTIYLSTRPEKGSKKALPQ